MSETVAEALARLYDLDLAGENGDLDLYRALAARSGSPIVELGVGTGRIAVPLAEAGHRVLGVDFDPAMLARAAARADRAGPVVAARVELVEGDLVELRLSDGGQLGLAILALNSILLLASADRQRAAIRTMAELLAPDGIAVVDARLPSPDELIAFDGRLSLEWLRTDPENGGQVAKLAAAQYDDATRTVWLTTLFDEGAPGAAPIRWTRTDELHLTSADEVLAAFEAAGLELEQVAGDYELTPFGPGSERIVVVGRRAARSGRLAGRRAARPRRPAGQEPRGLAPRAEREASRRSGGAPGRPDRP